MAGGTGGHIFPALCVAEQLKLRGHEVLWLGTTQGMEANIIPEAGIPLLILAVRGLRGKGWMRKLSAPFMILGAWWQALRLMKQHQPDVVLGMGGFASGPGGLAAWCLRIPLVIHEQNAIAGLTNRVLSRLATRVLQAFPNSFASNLQAITTGNPLRENMAAQSSPTERYQQRTGPLQVLVLGGSQGAAFLNELIPTALKKLDLDQMPKIWHQTGTKKLEETKAHYAAVEAEVNIEPFIENMAEAYAWADLVICRAGALTVSELIAVGVASFLVPYPHCADDHQTLNASLLSKLGAARLMDQRTLTAESLTADLVMVAGDRHQLMTLAQRAQQLQTPGATVTVMTHCLEVAR